MIDLATLAFVIVVLLLLVGVFVGVRRARRDLIATGIGVVVGGVLVGGVLLAIHLTASPVPESAIPVVPGTRVSVSVVDPGVAPPFHSYFYERYSLITTTHDGGGPANLERRVVTTLVAHGWGEEGSYSQYLRRFISSDGSWIVELATPTQAEAAYNQTQGGGYPDPNIGQQLAYARRAQRAGRASVFVELSTPRGDPFPCTKYPACV